MSTINVPEFCDKVLCQPTEDNPGLVLAFTKFCNDEDIHQLAETIFKLSADLFAAYVKREHTRLSATIIAASRAKISKFLKNQPDLGAKFEIITDTTKYSFGFSVSSLARCVQTFRSQKFFDAEIVDAISQLIREAIARSLPGQSAELEPPSAPSPTPPPFPITPHIASQNAPPKVLIANCDKRFELRSRRLDQVNLTFTRIYPKEAPLQKTHPKISECSK